MGFATDRVLLYDREDTFIGELAPNAVSKRRRIEQINDEHELVLETTRVLHEGTRVLTCDGTGKRREYVVYRPNERHERGKCSSGTYNCMWSLQYDLMGGYSEEHAEPGMGSACTADDALAYAIAGSPRWSVGTVDVPGVAAGQGCVMIGVSDWDRLKLVVEKWGGEVDAEITVDGTHVVSRSVALRAHLGSTTAKRRFDWGRDLKSISRTADDGPYYCRVVPLGRGQREYAEDDETEFDWPIDISEETGGRVYIQDDEAALVFRTKNPDGTYHYPIKVVEYDEDDPELLLNAALEDLTNHTRPGVSYEADVLQFAEAGMDAQGVELGDDAQCSDYGFNEDVPLKVEGRVVRMEVNELNPKGDTNLTIGDLAPSLVQTLSDLIDAKTSSLTKRINHIDGAGTIAYVEALINELNEQINATGGHSYITAGEGLVTYDIAVDDPLVGYNSATHTWASQVTQVKGGSIRFANTKQSSFAGINDWNWTNVITPAGYLGLAATIARITSGFIGSANDAVFLDFDNHVFQIGNSAEIGGMTVQQLLGDVASAGIDTIEYGTSLSSSTAPSTWSETVPSSVTKGSWLWMRTTYNDGGTSTTKTYVGEDGTSVSILGSYNTLSELEVAHPTGSQGDGYLVAGDLYVWNGAQWLDVGRIQGPAGQDGTSVTITSREVKYAKSSGGTTAPSSGWQDSPPSTVAGEYLWSRTTVAYNDGTSTVTYGVAAHGQDGADGTSVSVTATEYGTSASASAQPSSWSTTTPTSITKGTWLWVRTTYSNGSTMTSKSYAGTDGASVYVKSSTKTGDTTTVVLTDGTNDFTLTIVDGEDGSDGTDGLNGYVHTAWANSADGQTDFSTSVSTNKLYLGVYTDNTAADSQIPSSYSWSLIKGANGGKGDKGDKGDTGDSARAYSVMVSPDSLKLVDGSIVPSEMTVSATVAVGAATPQIYMGRLHIEEHDGTAWSTKYTSAANESSKTYQPTSSARMVRCTLFAAGGTTTQLDSQTVPVLSDGRDGTDGTDGTNGRDAYSVWLTNDSHTFPATSAAAIAGSVTTYIKVYRGATPVRPVTIGTLPAVPNGMTLTRLNNGSSMADAGLRISVTTALATRGGTIDIPITADGQSFTVTFSWALALEGVGIASIVQQYYLSTSDSSATGGSWSSNPPTWSAGHHIWTRSYITWDDGTTTTTDAVCDAALTQANQQAAQAVSDAAEAAKVATNYLHFDPTDGLDVGYDGTSSKVRVDGDGVEVFNSAGNSVAEYGTSARVGMADGYNTLISSDTFSMRRGQAPVFEVRTASGSETCLIIETFHTNRGGTYMLSYAPSSITSVVFWTTGVTWSSSNKWSDYSNYTLPSSSYTLSAAYNDPTAITGRRRSITVSPTSENSLAYGYLTVAYSVTVSSAPALRSGIGTESDKHGVAIGAGSKALAPAAVALGMGCSAGNFATGSSSAGKSVAIGRIAISDLGFAIGNNVQTMGDGAVALGSLTKAYAQGSMAAGYGSVASSTYSVAMGYCVFSLYSYQTVIGKYNASGSSAGGLIVGNGTSDSSRSNAMTLSNAGALWIAGTLTQNSDRRLKEHHAYLGEDAAEFVRALRPALFTKDGERHVGFYAQDVADAEPEGWDTATVTAQHTDESLDFDPLTLDYSALIAPLVAYAQGLERRIDKQQETIEALTRRIDALEGGSA